MSAAFAAAFVAAQSLSLIHIYRVQKRCEQNQKAPAHTRTNVNYMLTTKLFCRNCGSIMAGESGKVIQAHGTIIINVGTVNAMAARDAI